MIYNSIIISSVTDEKVGSSTKIETTVKPIIPENVTSWNLFRRNLVITIKINPPIINPIPIGIKILKDNVEIPFKYVEYIPSNINIIVLLIPRNNNTYWHQKTRKY